MEGRPDTMIFLFFFIYFQFIMAGKRKLRDEWLMKEEFRPWLSKVDGEPTKAYCNKCQKTFSSGLTAIKRHMVRFYYFNLITDYATLSVNNAYEVLRVG